MNIGNIAAREKLTGHLFFQRIGADYVDLGNVLLTKQTPKIDRAQQLTAQRGYLQVTHEAASKIDPRWSFKLDEQIAPQLQILNLAAATPVQEAVTNHQIEYFNESTDPTWEAGVIPEVPFQLPHVSLTSFNAGGLELDVEYTIDLARGIFTVTAAGAETVVSEGALWIMSYSANSVSTYSLLSESFVRGTAIIILSDQNDPAPRSKITFDAEIRASDWGENDGQKTGDFQLELLALTAPVVLSRE